LDHHTVGRKKLEWQAPASHYPLASLRCVTSLGTPISMCGLVVLAAAAPIPRRSSRPAVRVLDWTVDDPRVTARCRYLSLLCSFASAEGRGSISLQRANIARTCVFASRPVSIFVLAILMTLVLQRVGRHRNAGLHRRSEPPDCANAASRTAIARDCAFLGYQQRHGGET